MAMEDTHPLHMYQSVFTVFNSLCTINTGHAIILVGQTSIFNFIAFNLVLWDTFEHVLHATGSDNYMFKPTLIIGQIWEWTALATHYTTLSAPVHL